MRVGLGTGSTVAPLIPALAAPGPPGFRCVATSEATAQAAIAAGLIVESFDALPELDIAIDGARPDRARAVADQRWRPRPHPGEAGRRRRGAVRRHRLAREAGPAPHARPSRSSCSPSGSTSRCGACADAVPREGPPSPDGGIIADWTGEFDDPQALALRLDADPGVVGHGLFAPSYVTDVVVATGFARRAHAGVTGFADAANCRRVLRDGYRAADEHRAKRSQWR